MKIICLTPVKNESWIIERFLRCASLWADQIILGDQGCTDSTVRIAAKFPKVTIIKVPHKKPDSKKWKSIEFSGPGMRDFWMREPLFAAARKISGPKLLVSLDADEVISGNFKTSSEWDQILHLSPGTIINFPWVNIYPDMRHYWTPSNLQAKAFVDDGTPYIPHPTRTITVPFSEKSKYFTTSQLKILHYQYSDWERMRSKQRHNQCWERISNPGRSAVSIYRQYHHMYAVPPSAIKPLNPDWFKYYLDHGIDMFVVNKENKFWWDKEVENYIKTYGKEFFSKEDIWNRPKLIHRYLQLTQPYINRLPVQLIDRFLTKFWGW